MGKLSTWDKTSIYLGEDWNFKTNLQFGVKNKKMSILFSRAEVETARLTEHNKFMGQAMLYFQTSIDWEDMPFYTKPLLKRHEVIILEKMNKTLSEFLIGETSAKSYIDHEPYSWIIHTKVAIPFNNDRKKRESFTDSALRLLFVVLNQIEVSTDRFRNIYCKKETFILDKLKNWVPYSKYLEMEWMRLAVQRSV